jgi:phage tail sheath protein FI
MAEFLSPGVFIEEVPSQIQVIQGVSTSNGAFVGYTPQGPSDTPTLVTSWDQFVSVFGDIVTDSFLGYNVAAFFSNGGRRAYIVRIVPADATNADATINSATTDQYVQKGDGSTTVFTEAAPAPNSTLKVNSGASPILASTVSVEWRVAGTPVPAAALKQRDGTTNLAGDATQYFYEGRVDPAALIAVREGLWVIDPDIGGGTGLVITYTETGPITITLDTLGADGKTMTNSTTTDGVVTLDLETGFVSMDLTNHGTVPDAAAMTIAVVPTAAETATDDGAGVWTGDVSVPGTISYTAGTYSLNPNTAPVDEGKMLWSYEIDAWDLDPISAGTWGADLRVRVSGSVDHFTATTGLYSKFDVDIFQADSVGNYQIKESYEELDFSTTTDAMYFADVLNDLSNLVNVVEPAGDEPPGQLLTIPRSTVIAGGGDGATTGLSAITATLGNVPVQPRTVSITYVEAAGGTTRTITDDGNGNLTGSVDAAGTNTINYTSGAINVTVASGDTIQANSLVRVAYYEAPAETAHTEDFSGGTNGTFDSTNYGRNQFTAISLAASNSGVYALNSVEDILNLCIPDFVGDTTITGDILDYIDGRESQPRGRDRFAILSVPVGSTAQEASDWFRFELGRFSKNAALYWPHVKVADPLVDNRDKVIPPLGHIAGVYARTDATKNVAKAPAGTVDGALRFITGLEVETTQGDRDIVYPNKINPLVSGPQTGLAVWGARTISNESDWRYINVSRLFMFLGNSIFNATHWVVFENNGPQLWNRIKTQLNGFLGNLYREGYFAGNSPNEAFTITVDGTNNTADVINAGQVIVDVAVAPQIPAEFVRFRLTQKAL